MQFQVNNIKPNTFVFFFSPDGSAGRIILSYKGCVWSFVIHNAGTSDVRQKLLPRVHNDIETDNRL